MGPGGCRLPMAERFWSGVSCGDPHECWPWGRACNRDGYGRFKVAGHDERAHRAAYLLAKGDVPAGLVVRHLCHNRKCCNPAHLELGTQEDNVRDMVEAGRSTAGERNPKARLTADQARAICRRYYEEGATLKEIGTEYGVNLATVGYITQGKTWGAETIDLREEYEERAAIMQNDGGMSQATAEDQALKRVLMRRRQSRAKSSNLVTAPRVSK